MERGHSRGLQKLPIRTGRWIIRKDELVHRDSGFTLIEIIIIIALVGVFMAAIGLPFVSGIRQSQLPEIVATADFLAVEELERIAGMDYSIIPTGTWPLENPVPGFPGYRRQVIVTDVMDTGADLDPANPQLNSGFRHISVTVFHNELPAGGISLETLRTDY